MLKLRTTDLEGTPARITRSARCLHRKVLYTIMCHSDILSLSQVKLKKLKSDTTRINWNSCGTFILGLFFSDASSLYDGDDDDDDDDDMMMMMMISVGSRKRAKA